jgi:hypothetical protein
VFFSAPPSLSSCVTLSSWVPFSLPLRCVPCFLVPFSSRLPAAIGRILQVISDVWPGMGWDGPARGEEERFARRRGSAAIRLLGARVCFLDRCCKEVHCLLDRSCSADLPTVLASPSPSPRLRATARVRGYLRSPSLRPTASLGIASVSSLLCSPRLCTV